MGVKCGGPMPGSPWSWPRLALRSKGSGPRGGAPAPGPALLPSMVEAGGGW